MTTDHLTPLVDGSRAPKRDAGKVTSLVKLLRRTVGVQLVELLPPGAISVGAGLVLSGFGAFAFLALASHALSPKGYASLATLWSLTFLIWPGSFIALEREAARRLVIDRPHDTSERHSLDDVLEFGVLWIGVVLLAIVVFHPYLDHLFRGDDWLILDLALAGPAIAVQYIAFGVFAGNRRFAQYSLVGAFEGLSRLALAGLLLMGGVHGAGPLGMTLAAAPLVAVAATSGTLRRSRWRGSLFGAERMTTLSWSLGSNVCLALLANAGPVLVRMIGPNQPAVLTGRFLSALVIVRIPVFLYAAASATLMPALSSSALQRQWLVFRQTLKRLVILVLALGGAGVPLAALIGPPLTRVVFGNTYVLDRASLGFLAATSGLLILGSTLSVALTATGAVRYMFVAWLTGIVALVLCCLLPLSVIRRVELALLVGSALPTLVMAPGLFLRGQPVASRHLRALVRTQVQEI